MGYWIDPTEKCVGNQKSFYCDTTSDIATLPTASAEGTPQSDSSTVHKKVAKGSSVYCIGNARLYILDSTNTWKQQ